MITFFVFLLIFGTVGAIGAFVAVEGGAGRGKYNIFDFGGTGCCPAGKTSLLSFPGKGLYEGPRGKPALGSIWLPALGASEGETLGISLWPLGRTTTGEFGGTGFDCGAAPAGGYFDIFHCATGGISGGANLGIVGLPVLNVFFIVFDGVLFKNLFMNGLTKLGMYFEAAFGIAGIIFPANRGIFEGNGGSVGLPVACFGVEYMGCLVTDICGPNLGTNCGIVGRGGAVTGC